MINWKFIFFFILDGQQGVSQASIKHQEKKKKKYTEQTLQHHLKLKQTQNTVTDTDEKTEGINGLVWIEGNEGKDEGRKEEKKERNG